jgi:predicted dehydrogenase
MNRRQFLQSCTAASLAALPAWGQAERTAPTERITAAVMGVRGRGGALLRCFAAQPDVDLKYICDIDANVLEERTAEIASGGVHRPESIADFRRALDDAEVDVLVIGTPDHWHALPAIMACQAGKDVYVEKPDAHNLIEGRVMVAAMRKYGRVVQLGTQSRNGAHLASAIGYIATGALGKVRFARAWESAKQGGIGRPPDSEPPPGVDYDTWLGPAPLRPFNPRRFHSSWRWFFDYGTGDLGNDGVHRLDNALRALNAARAAEGQDPVDWPRSVSAHGGKYYFDDAQEWPDTLLVSYDFPGCVMTYEMRIYTPYPYEGFKEGAALYGDAGWISIGNGAWKAFDADGNGVAGETAALETDPHVRDFLECVRTRNRPAADLETVGHVSSALWHLGNAAWRAGRSLRFDPDSYTFTGDAEANRYLTRPEYRAPWLLPTVDEV